MTALLLQPLRVPGFAFAWLELISHRSFMPKLLLAPGHKGWSHFQRLLVALLRFLEPYLRNAELTDAVRLLYKVWLLWGMLYLCCPVLAPQLQLLLPIKPTTCPLLLPQILVQRKLLACNASQASLLPRTCLCTACPAACSACGVGEAFIGNATTLPGPHAGHPACAAGAAA